MTVHGESSGGVVEAVIEHLTSEYRGIVPPATVAVVVLDAQRDLHGQVVPGSLDEMLYRLAAVRLQELRSGRIGGAAREGREPVVPAPARR